MIHDQEPRTPVVMQEMFQRVITGWAMDALALRRRGLDKPSSRDGAALALPDRSTEPLPLRYPVQPAINWRRHRGKAA